MHKPRAESSTTAAIERGGCDSNGSDGSADFSWLPTRGQPRIFPVTYGVAMTTRLGREKNLRTTGPWCCVERQNSNQPDRDKARRPPRHGCHNSRGPGRRGEKSGAKGLVATLDPPTCGSCSKPEIHQSRKPYRALSSSVVVVVAVSRCSVFVWPDRRKSTTRHFPGRPSRLTGDGNCLPVVGP